MYMKQILKNIQYVIGNVMTISPKQDAAKIFENNFFLKLTEIYSTSSINIT